MSGPDRLRLGCPALVVGLVLLASSLALLPMAAALGPGWSSWSIGLPIALLMSGVVLLVFGLAVLVSAGWARPEVGPQPPLSLRALERRLRCAQLRQGPTGEWTLEGRLDGERVSVSVLLQPVPEVAARVEAVVPLTATVALAAGALGAPVQRGKQALPEALKAAPVDEALRALLLRCETVDVGLRAVEARFGSGAGHADTERFADDLERALRHLARVAAAVRTDTPPPPDPVARLLATRTRGPAADGPMLAVRREGQVCPYCRDALDLQEDDAVACAACATPHHRVCFEENGRCTVRGCERRRAERVGGS